MFECGVSDLEKNVDVLMLAAVFLLALLIQRHPLPPPRATTPSPAVGPAPRGATAPPQASVATAATALAIRHGRATGGRRPPGSDPPPNLPAARRAHLTAHPPPDPNLSGGIRSSHLPLQGRELRCHRSETELL